MVDLFEHAIFWGIASVGIGGAMFLVSGDMGVAVAAAVALPMTVVALGSIVGLCIWVCGGVESRALRSLGNVDRDWQTKVSTAKRRLRSRAYRWQLSEFGDASKAFAVAIHRRNGELALGSFIAENDTDLFRMGDHVSDAEFEQIWGERSEAVSKLTPSPEALDRLHTSLTETLDRELGGELLKALLKHGMIDLDTRVGYPL